jgi:hypothetical protein
VIETDFTPLAGPYKPKRRRPFAARVLMRCVGFCIDLARWLMAPKP